MVRGEMAEKVDATPAHVEAKSTRGERKRRRCGRNSSRQRATLCVFGILLIAIAAVLNVRGVSQQFGDSKIDVQSRSRDIVAHLNSVIQFYRDSMQPIQRAGEPNDAVYRDQAVGQSTQIAAFAFQSAKADAALLAKYQAQAGGEAASDSTEQQKMQATEANVEKQIDSLQTNLDAIEKQIATAKPRDLAALEAQKKQIKESLNLSSAIKDALQKILGMSGIEGGTGLAADIDRLQHSVPELQSQNKTAAPQLTMLSSARSAGVTSQGSVLIELFETRHSLDGLLKQNADLERQAVALRAPLAKILRGIIQQGQLLTQPPQVTTSLSGSSSTSSIANPTPAAMSSQGTSQGAAGNFESITKEFKALSAATVPLSQEIIMLEQSRANLDAWKSSANREYASILHALLLRVIVIAVALGLILGGGELWRRATSKYVHDIRRRRQFFIVRRFVVGFLSVIVVVFGFVTQFNSLATFAGFITAGIAVGLQTMLLSVAAYFFIIGRYGIKVGDRITIASVTGDVVDVGLVRFYLMELAGSGTSLSPTGRIAVFSNAVLFQAGTPLYKQIPGTDYAWHELIVKLNDSADYKMVSESVMREVQNVYEQYRPHIEQQHQGAESWMQTSIDQPGLESRLQFTGGSFQLWLRFPVEIDHASDADEKIIRALLALISKSPEIKAAVAATPVIQASVKG
jgi:small-conductance mechanosensitive channel